MARPSATPVLPAGQLSCSTGQSGRRSLDRFRGQPSLKWNLRAAVEALRLTPTGARIELRSDSELLIDGMRFLVFRWQRFGWRNSRGFELQHQELWRELLQLNETANNSLAMDQRTQRPSHPVPRRCTCLPSRQSSRRSGTNCRLMLLADHNSSEEKNHVNDCRNKFAF